jgi:hypothetical protein
MIPDRDTLLEIASECKSYSELARQIGVTKVKLHRFLSKDPDLKKEVGDQLSPRSNYTFDGEKYTFNMRGLPDIEIEKDRWAAVCFDYSKAGGNLTKSQVAQKHDIPFLVLENCLKKYEFYKSSAPCTHEEMEKTSDLEPLIEESLQAKTYRFQQEIERREIGKLKEGYKKLYEREQDRRAIAKELSEEFKGLVGDIEPPKPIQREVLEGGIYHCPLADVHSGLQVWGTELWADDYDLETACERIVDHADRSASFINSQGGASEVYMTDLGDTFHTLTGATEKGTQLHMDSRPKKIWRKTVDAKIRAINKMLTVSPKVKVIATEGNHDFIFNFLLYEALEMYFHTDPRVEVLTTVSPQSHFIVGDTMHLLLHGSKLGQLTSPKVKSTVEIIARQSAGKEYLRAQKIKVYVGHLHSSQVETQGGHMELIRLPAVANTDDYAQSLGYYSIPGARIFRLDEHGDIDIEKRLNWS